MRLALEKVVELEKVEVPEEELSAEYAKLAEQYKMEEDKVRGYIPEADLKLDLAVNKVIAMLKDSADITEVEEVKEDEAKDAE